VAAAVFGAVRRSPSQSYSVKGGRNYTGTAPRSSEQLAGLGPYADILRDYCNQGDPICAVGSQPVDVGQHLDYFTFYNGEAADFIVRTAKGEKVEVEHEDGNGNGISNATVSGTQVAEASSTAKSPQTGAAMVCGVEQIVLWAMVFAVTMLLQ
jgi:acetylxylan esterase